MYTIGKWLTDKKQEGSKIFSMLFGHFQVQCWNGCFQRLELYPTMALMAIALFHCSNHPSNLKLFFLEMRFNRDATWLYWLGRGHPQRFTVLVF